MAILPTYQAEDIPEIVNLFLPDTNLESFITKVDKDKQNITNNILDNYILQTNNNKLFKSTSDFPSLFKNGDTVEIKTKKSKYGHTATYYNGRWYSDFALKNMNPYNDPNALIRIFRNPNLAEAELLAARIASRAGLKSKHLCAKYVREGLGYQAAGYNGGNFGDFLLKKGWTRIAKNGMQFTTENTIIPTYQSVELPMPKYLNNPYQQKLTFTTYVDKDNLNTDNTVHHNNWWDNYNLASSEVLAIIPQTQAFTNTAIDSVINRIVKGGYCPEPSYGGKLKSLVISAQKATGKNKEFIDSRISSYKSRGVDDNTALVYAALDALESGWGKHQAGKNNLGGIKNGNKGWRNFNSLDDYTDYKVKLLSSKRYNK